ncbi:hypothetical protein T4B_5298 [Trichinella pseudospiralis]|uniref:Uncharacterized protein n=2 Tax=Trichinella pseudospiralis TaxID=6337 RepID=A0A0V1GST3_TRIPS|nr:hypothetical protein T4B_5298 [Trichinella pseudospiralis]
MLFTFYGILKIETIINVVSLIDNASAITISATDKPKITEDKSNAKSASFTIAAVAFASSVFNREHYRRERHLLKLMDPVRGLNTNLCFITSTMTAIPINADPKIDFYNP